MRENKVTGRNNYPVDKRFSYSDNISRVHSIILRMLKIFDMICKDHKIDYWLEYGTLLGAIRHNGFIPWDSEADIGMLRPDFKKFYDIALSDLPSDILFQTKETDPDFLPSSYYIEAKLRDKYSNYYEFSKQNPSIKWHNGIQVDIFVYDLDPELDGCITNAFERLFSNGKIHLKLKEIEYVIEHAFEDHIFPIPIGYDNYLMRNYGDYFTLPLQEMRKPQYVEVFPIH